MATMEEYAKLPREEKLKRMERGPDDLAAAVRGRDDAALSRRPDAKNWAAKEVVCHLRDTEEGFMARFEAMLAMDDLKLLPVNPDRWAEERQYLRNDCGDALGAYRKRREETLAFLKKLAADQWSRAAVHPARGRMTYDDFVTLIAWHDENHLDQLKRALQGQV